MITAQEWSGYPDPTDPDNFWIDDKTGERVDARTGERRAINRAQKPAIVHLRDLRLRNNAGMDFPACYAGARLLDMDKSRLPTTGDRAAVTCKRCRRIKL